VVGKLVHTCLGSSYLIAHVLHCPPRPPAHSFLIGPAVNTHTSQCGIAIIALPKATPTDNLLLSVNSPALPAPKSTQPPQTLADRQLCVPRSCLTPLLLLRHTQQTFPLDVFRIWRKIGNPSHAKPVSPGGALDHAHAVTAPVNSPPPPRPPPSTHTHHHPLSLSCTKTKQNPSSKQIHTTPL
jgi:hypothetical protein